MRILTLVAMLAISPMASAGIFSQNEPCPFEMNPDGTAKPLPLNVFKLFLNDRVEALQATTPEFQPGSTTRLNFKGFLRQRILTDLKGTPSRAAMVGLSADLLRLGRPHDVIEFLKPTLQDRTLDYRLLAHLSMAHAALGDWDLALKRNADAVLDGEPPTELAGTKPEQLKWMLKIDKTYTRAWLLSAQRDANPATRPAEPDVPPLFAKARPADAVAVAQQMVLWSPLDANLLWLLGALYLENGQAAEAFDILEQCRDRKLTWSKFRDQHKRAEALFRAMPKSPSNDDFAIPTTPVPDETQKGLFAIVDPLQFAIAVGAFGLLTLGLFGLQVRRWRRSRRLPTAH